MTKQEEIREGIYQTIKQHREDTIPLIADEILTYLHSQGVAIKGDRELPEHKCYKHKDTINLDCFTCGDIVGRTHTQSDMLKAGYVAVESLIEEVK